MPHETLSRFQTRRQQRYFDSTQPMCNVSVDTPREILRLWSRGYMKPNSSYNDERSVACSSISGASISCFCDKWPFMLPVQLMMTYNFTLKVTIPDSTTTWHYPRSSTICRRCETSYFTSGSSCVYHLDTDLEPLHNVFKVHPERRARKITQKSSVV